MLAAAAGAAVVNPFVVVWDVFQVKPVGWEGGKFIHDYPGQPLGPVEGHDVELLGFTLGTRPEKHLDAIVESIHKGCSKEPLVVEALAVLAFMHFDV